VARAAGGLFALIAALVVWQAGAFARTDSQTLSPAQALDAYYFSDLSTMVATSDAVVVGVIESTNRGPKLGEAGWALQLRVVDVRIEEVLHGDVSRGDGMFYELGWGSQGQPLLVNDTIPSDAGQQGIFFLRRADSPSLAGAFVYTNSQARYLLSERGSLEPANQEDSFSGSLAERGFEQLRRDVLRESERVRSGEVTPQEAPPRAS
jgi:hypothetical protein